MNAKPASYKRVKNTGDFNNEQCEIVVELETGETAEQGFKQVKAFVNKSLEIDTESLAIRQAKRIAANPDEYSHTRVKDAKKLLAETAVEEIEITI